MLGDREAQEQIRQASPDKVHCKLLQDVKFGPSFCPQCPNNPYLDKSTGERSEQGEALQLMEGYGGIVEEAVDLGLRVRYGLPVEFSSWLEEEIALVAASEIEVSMLRGQANIIASKLSEVFVAMFGKR